MAFALLLCDKKSLSRLRSNFITFARHLVSLVSRDAIRIKSKKSFALIGCVDKWLRKKIEFTRRTIDYYHVCFLMYKLCNQIAQILLILVIIFSLTFLNTKPNQTKPNPSRFRISIESGARPWDNNKYHFVIDPTFTINSRNMQEKIRRKKVIKWRKKQVTNDDCETNCGSHARFSHVRRRIQMTDTAMQMFESRSSKKDCEGEREKFPEWTGLEPKKKSRFLLSPSQRNDKSNRAADRKSK